ncbi:PhaM family polyhydroxyalkanoate granule multifunctional regulatory protein [Aquabacterium sp. A08]|uniref:PhaM family polyhydroxyalkanoate granule multifunctional regulatory protein n=1 Tax=Aquabacterium sp. A08 TaxID=2718532 RepID=UPI0014223B25|nr:PhaM family polyhydroxyalkanoate granule multifunctional regulatory protein [Aquabacterium sp. A08]NIC42944.1 hypothetical protein [Aquabacterium sp. A08]
MSTPDLNAFAQYIPGFEFLQNLTRQAAGSVAPGLQSGVPGMPPMSHWVAPTFDVEELDKRIQDLRAVHFWLDQNTKALGATIQALEVQKMTLATLKGMNVSMGEMAEAFKIRPEAATPPAAAPAASPAPAPEPADGAAASRPAVDPMQWWNSLTEQFQTIAAGAVRDMADQASRAAEQVAQTVQASAEAASQMTAAATEAAPAPAQTAPKPRAAAKSAQATPAKAAAKPPRAVPAADRAAPAKKAAPRSR